MFRSFFLSLALISIVAWCAMTIACGSSSTKSTTCTGGPYNVVGNWQVSVQSGTQPVTGYGAIDSAGLALFFDNSTSTGNSGDTLQLPTITGSCAFSGNIIDYEKPGGPSSGQSTTDTAQGNVTSATALNGTFSSSSGSGTFTAATFSPLSGTVGVVTGTKTGEVQGEINNQEILLPGLVFSASGSGDSMSFASSSNPACNVSGTFTQVDTANVFDVSITFTSTGGIGCDLPGTFTGIGFESNSDYFGFNGNNPADTYLYADILASSNTFVMEIF
jgi:hypothetical protein